MESNTDVGSDDKFRPQSQEEPKKPLSPKPEETDEQEEVAKAPSPKPTSPKPPSPKAGSQSPKTGKTFPPPSPKQQKAEPTEPAAVERTKSFAERTKSGTGGAETAVEIARLRKEMEAGLEKGVAFPLCCYTFVMRCPVLSYAFISLWSHAFAIHCPALTQAIRQRRQRA